MTTIKGGAFLTDSTAPESVFIPEEWNDEQLLLMETVRDFFIDEVQSIGIEQAAQIDVSKDLPLILEVFHKAAELGFCGVSIQEEYGGMDLDFNTSLFLMEALAHGFSFATTIGAQTSIGSLPIVFYGTPEQKAKYLPGIATGETKTAYALTEPAAGSDANSGKTKAIPNGAGTHYLLTGQKMWITNGGFADLFIVFAKIEQDKNLTAFIVEKAFGGITIGKEEKKLGIKASSTTQVFFEECAVPIENLLGERGGGFKMALNILNTGRIKLCAGALGGSKFATTRAIEYASQRKQFGQSIADFGAIKYKIGEMVMRIHTAESATYRTGYNVDQKCKELLASGATPSEAKLKSVKEFAIECALLKVAGSEVLDYVVDEVLQVHGGMGYAVETGIELGYRDARITRIYEGTNEINRLLSVAELTKRAIKTKEIDLLGAGKKIPIHLLKQLLPFKSTSGLRQEKRLIENLKKLFLLLSGAAGNKLKEKMVNEQEIVMNLADILNMAFLAESTLLRYEKLKQIRPDSDQLKVQHQILQLYLYEALQQARKLGEDIVTSYAKGGERKMLLWLSSILLPKYSINPKELRRGIADFAILSGKYPF